MAKTAAEISRDLRDRKYEASSERSAREVAETKARIAATSVPRSKRMAGYRQNSKLEAEASEGARQHATLLERDKARAKRR